MHIVRGLEADFIYSFADAMRGMDCHTLACRELVEGFAMTAGSWKAQRGNPGFMAQAAQYPDNGRMSTSSPADKAILRRPRLPGYLHVSDLQGLAQLATQGTLGVAGLAETV